MSHFESEVINLLGQIADDLRWLRRRGDMPQIISLSLASPDSWGTLPSPVWMEDYPPATGQEAQAREYSSPSS